MNTDDLIELRACPDAVKWCETQPDLATAWRNCERGDWMLWLLWKTSKYGDDQYIAHIRIACRIARDVLHLVTTGDERPRLAIESAEAWCNDPTARAAGVAGGAARAAGVAWGAAWAAWAAGVAGDAARAAGVAGGAARAAGDTTLKKYASWVREIFPELPEVQK